MRRSFTRLIEEVPTEVYSQTSTLIGADVAFFRPRAYIVNKLMRTEDYSVIFQSSPIPPARIGKREHEFKQSGLSVIGPGLEFLCTAEAPTQEYVNLMINKEFLDSVALDIIGKRPDFSKIDYVPSARLRRLVADLEDELTNFSDAAMLRAIMIQLAIQLLRDSGQYSSPIGSDNMEYGLNPRPASFALLASFNEAAEVRLTDRELEVAAYLLERYDYESIAQMLYISPNTLKTHVKHIYRKLNVSGRKDLLLKVSGNNSAV